VLFEYSVEAALERVHYLHRPPRDYQYDLLNLQKGRPAHPRNAGVNAVDKVLNLGNGDAKASFGRDTFLAFVCAGNTASPKE